MSKLPEVGDTIIIRGIVTEITPSYDGSIVKYIDQNGSEGRVLASRISEVIPKPWEPKAGDRVKYLQSNICIYTILGLDGNSAWIKSPNMQHIVDKGSLTSAD